MAKETHDVDDALLEEGYDKAVELLGRCSTEDGFLASTVERDNYRRVWGRDGCMMGLAALMTGRDDLVDTCRRTLETLAEHQGPHGEIPSNVDTGTRRISYGGTAGRVDADLWFLVCCGQYVKATGDDRFLDRRLDAIERTRFLLGAWEYNARGLLYVPLTGDWADEYLHTGYVFYDQLLYLQAQREMGDLHRRVHESADHRLRDRVSRLKQLIRANYWFAGGEEPPDHVYHEVLYEKAKHAKNRCAGCYWAPFFSPAGYGYRFDTLANTLVSMLGVADDQQCERVDRYIAENVLDTETMLLPAFHPVITQKDEDWEDLQMTFSYTFKNKPYEYHNGGLWPMVTGFYAADLARRGRRGLARAHLAGVHRANRSENTDGNPWSFPEYIHGREHTPEGTRYQGWNAAAAIFAHHALNGERLFDHGEEE